jgi:hypothetical protein
LPRSLQPPRPRSTTPIPSSSGQTLQTCTASGDRLPAAARLGVAPQPRSGRSRGATGAGAPAPDLRFRAHLPSCGKNPQRFRAVSNVVRGNRGRGQSVTHDEGRSPCGSCKWNRAPAACGRS